MMISLNGTKSVDMALSVNSGNSFDSGYRLYNPEMMMLQAKLHFMKR